LFDFNLFSLLVLILYAAVMLLLWYGWKKLPENKVFDRRPKLTISIIIAARNETLTLPLLLSDLARQNYPSELFEIIVIDDHSDRKLSLLPEVRNYSGSNLHVYDLPESKHGKKEALLEGTKFSMGEILLFTDADCRVSPYWIMGHAEKYLQEQPAVIIGLVDFQIKKNVFQVFSRIDFLSLIITGAGCAGLNKPVMCNGANLSVRKELYNNLSDQLRNSIFSGDDVFLLHAVKRLKNEKISVLKNYDCIVKSRTPESFKEFINQRMRWASKSRNYSDPDTIALAMLVLMTNLVLAVAAVLFLLSDSIFVFTSLLLIKTIADLYILSSGLKFFGGSIQLLLIPLFEIVYPFYMLFIAFGSLFLRISWKGRRF
jgi:cellulose synthase/poly-beta-1,6-N-acetylglucosamine synthase-like glycosyltransferase